MLQMNALHLPDLQSNGLLITEPVWLVNQHYQVTMGPSHPTPHLHSFSTSLGTENPTLSWEACSRDFGEAIGQNDPIKPFYLGMQTSVRTRFQNQEIICYTA